jgi:hypothetical protein
MDPLVQHELRSLTLKYLQCFVNEHDELDRYRDCDREDWNTHEDSVLFLLPPPVRPFTESEKDENEAFLEKNGRKQCFLAACISLASAAMAAGKFRPVRCLLLINNALSLLLLWSKFLGLPPIGEFPATTVAAASSSKPTSSTTIVPKGRIHRRLVDYVRNHIRWKWHVLSGLNAVVVVLAFKVLVQVLFVGKDLVLTASVVLVVGNLIDSKAVSAEERQQQQQQQLQQQQQQPPGEQKDATWVLEDRRICGGLFLALYAAWHSSWWLAVAIGFVTFRRCEPLPQPDDTNDTSTN